MLSELRQYFGFDSFREGQEQVVRALLDGRPALAIFPTGGGKSICYQLPALLLDGITLVVSPLIALMKDQVDALTARGIFAARLDSTLEAEELKDVYQRLDDGSIKLLYIAPERFSNEAFRTRIRKLPVALIAIDEAHCISEWGHNFRPDYLKLARICRKLKIQPVLALTATATPKVARDIRKHFRISAADQIQRSFHRPNLDLRVTPCSANERKNILLDRLSSVAGPVIVYVTRQETAEEIATFLGKNGIAARAYHAGLPVGFRADAQQAFMHNTTRAMVATIAFGMGIDKADIRGVIHYNLPKSLENYTQEIGRAGRDGEPSVCEMLVCPDDLTVLENFIHADAPSPRSLSNLLDRVLRLEADFDVSLYELSTTCDIRISVVETVMTYLEIDGSIEAIGSFHANCRLKLLRPIEQIFSGRSSAEKTFIKRLIEAGEMRKIWLHLPIPEICGKLGCDRKKILSTLASLEAAEDASVVFSGIRHAYRRKKEPEDMALPAREMAELFRQREQADLLRLQQVLAIASNRGCLTAALLKHFGESLADPCGHCDRCRGIPANKVKRRPLRKVTMDELEIIGNLVSEKHAPLSSARQLARFLCGMTSPATIRFRLTRHDAFGLLSDLPFNEVLVIAESLIP